eukprot:jgi/Hompol1/5272/HPOL_004294-RA
MSTIAKDIVKTVQSKEQPEGDDHPHRGFETVTYMLTGAFNHEDFLGNSGTIAAGDLQWMTAGKAIMHAEMPATDNATGLQLWVNLPSHAKMMNPRYQELPAHNVPDAVSPDGAVKVKVIAGRSYGVEAKVHTFTPIYYLDVKMDKNAVFDQEIPAGYTTFVYTLDGAATFGSASSPSPTHCTLVFGKEGNHVSAKTGDSTAHFVLIAGEPIDEPIVQYGPFVMNTQKEIQEAMMDFQLGRNGFENASSWSSKIARRNR